MGNRATVHLKGDIQDRGIYVHWNGGKGCMAAFLEEASKRMKASECLGDEEQEIISFYSILFGVCREYFGYCSSYKTRGARNVYHVYEDVMADSDNGCYQVEDDYTCSRTDVSKLSPAHLEDYKTTAQFFAEANSAMCVVIDSEQTCYTDKSTTEDHKAELLLAEEVARSAADRVESLKAKIAAAEAPSDEEVAA